jgi:DNA-cytosine methyltransferase
MNVLSGFDGMSCGQIALNRAGIKYDKYFASEIDKFAIKATQRNFTETIQLGSIVTVKATALPPIDLFMGGSPCQGFSNSGKGLNFEDPRSKLFFEFVRILKELREINPNVKFLLENVRMKKEWEDAISRILEIQPININSALVSAQNRERLYWTNIGMSQRGLFGDNYCTIPHPKDRNIFLKDILQPTHEVAEKYYISEKALSRILRKNYSDAQINPEKTVTLDTKNNSGQLSVNSGITLITERGKSHEYQIEDSGKVPPLTSRPGCEHDNRVVVGCISTNGEIRDLGDDKSLCIDTNYFKGIENHGQRTMVREPIQINPSTESGGAQPYQQNRIYDVNGIAPALTAELGGERQIMVAIPEVEVINTFPRSSTSGKGGTGELKRTDVKTYCIDTQQNQVVKVPQADRIYDTEDKSVTSGARNGGLGAGTGLYNVKERFRRLTPIEVCRLQTVPDDYFFKEEGQIVSDSQIYKQCGNGWTVDVIAHILSYLPAQSDADERSVATRPQ